MVALGQHVSAFWQVGFWQVRATRCQKDPILAMDISTGHCQSKGNKVKDIDLIGNDIVSIACHMFGKFGHDTLPNWQIYVPLLSFLLLNWQLFGPWRRFSATWLYSRPRALESKRVASRPPEFCPLSANAQNSGQDSVMPVNDVGAILAIYTILFLRFTQWVG